MYITSSNSSVPQTASEIAARQRRAQHRAKQADVSGSSSNSSGKALTRSGDQDKKAAGAAVFPIETGRISTDMRSQDKTSEAVEYFQNPALLNARGAQSFNLYTNNEYPASSGIRGSLADDVSATRRGQDAVATYSEHQMLEERNYFTQVTGIDEYA